MSYINLTRVPDLMDYRSVSVCERPWYANMAGVQESRAVWRRKAPMNILQAGIICGAAWVVVGLALGIIVGRILRGANRGG